MVVLAVKFCAERRAITTFYLQTKESVDLGRLEHIKFPQLFTQLSVALSVLCEYGFEGKLS